MKSVKLIVVLLALVIIPAVYIVMTRGPEVQITPPPSTNRTESVTIQRPTVECGVTNKLVKGAPLRLKLTIGTRGKASLANWGVKGIGSFFLETDVECLSEIINAVETKQGYVKVEEKRTFTEAQQTFMVFDTDAMLDLYRTLPLKASFTVTKCIGAVLTAIPATTAAGGTTLATAKALEKTCQAIDGSSVKDVLEAYGVDVPRELKEKLNEFINKEIKEARVIRPEEVKGRSYLITYVQESRGRPVEVGIRRFDDEQPLTERETLLLRRVNALIDWQILKGGSHEIGSEWKVDSRDFECLFDPYVDGHYCGEVSVRRGEDYDDGDWNVEIKPGFVDLVSDKDESRTTGTVRIDFGSVKIDQPKCQIKKMELLGEAGAKNLSEHHLLFKAHVDGECKFDAKLTSEPVK